MFHTDRFHHQSGFIEYRKEVLTGLSTRISPERLNRGIHHPEIPRYDPEGCPFCPEMVTAVTPVFPDGKRIQVGESITFPNLYPFARYHVVTVITAAHQVDRFTSRQLADALTGMIRALAGQPGYVSLNWNYLPSAGASLVHPHMQGLADSTADTLPGKYLSGSRKYREETGERWGDHLLSHEQAAGRILHGLSLPWFANPVPIGEREIRCLLPVTTLFEFPVHIPAFAADLSRVLDFLTELGSSAWNMSLFFGTDRDRDYYSAFCSVISRINPNPLSTSDTAFMERLHLEPVIMTMPEELADAWQESAGETGLNKNR